MRRIVAITGLPGAGKTTLAGPLAERLGAVLISPGDAARQADPGAIAEGRMADEALIRGYMFSKWAEHADELMVLDGYPRTTEQARVLPRGSRVVWITVRPSVAARRLRERGRSDDTQAVIERRLSEQARLMADMPGWASIQVDGEREPQAVLDWVYYDLNILRFGS